MHLTVLRNTVPISGLRWLFRSGTRDDVSPARQPRRAPACLVPVTHRALESEGRSEGARLRRYLCDRRRRCWHRLFFFAPLRWASNRRHVVAQLRVEYHTRSRPTSRACCQARTTCNSSRTVKGAEKEQEKEYIPFFRH